MTHQTPDSVEEYVVLSLLQFNPNNKVCSCKLAEVTVHTTMFVSSIRMSTCAHSCTHTHTHTFGIHQYICVKHMYVNVQTIVPCSFQAEGDTNYKKSCCGGRIREVTRDDKQNRVVRVEYSALGKAMQ